MAHPPPKAKEITSDDRCRSVLQNAEHRTSKVDRRTLKSSIQRWMLDVRRSTLLPSSERLQQRSASIPAFLRGAAAVCRWELASFFRRPVSYLLLLAASLAAAWAFGWLVALLARGGVALRMADDPVRQFLGPNVFLIASCTLLVPLLTMGLVADERRRATWEFLLTSPVSRGAVFAGKFFAAWALFAVCVSPWVMFLLLLRVWSGGTRWIGGVIPWFETPGVPFDLGPIAAGAIGLALVGGTFVACGLFCSSLCRRPISAALLSALVMGLSLLAALAPRLLEAYGLSENAISFARNFSSWGQLEWFSRGTILPRVIVGHLSLWLALLWLTTHLSRRLDDA